MVTMPLKSGEATRLRLRLNPIKCTAFGFCAEHAPELFSLDDWGYGWLHSRDVPVGLEGLAAETCRLCPTGALSLEPLPKDGAGR